jgi:hypothetical protein
LIGTGEERPSVPSPGSSDDRETIYFNDPADDIDFITLHNILYFVYIGYVNLQLPNEGQEDSLPEGYPEEACPFRLFRNADRFLLPTLKEHCLYNLRHGITPENVAERLFHPDCQHHPELKDLYFQYLIANYHQVIETEGWERALCNDEEVSTSTRNYRSRLLVEITRASR